MNEARHRLEGEHAFGVFVLTLWSCAFWGRHSKFTAALCGQFSNKKNGEHHGDRNYTHPTCPDLFTLFQPCWYGCRCTFNDNICHWWMSVLKLVIDFSSSWELPLEEVADGLFFFAAGGATVAALRILCLHFCGEILHRSPTDSASIGAEFLQNPREFPSFSSTQTGVIACLSDRRFLWWLV